MDEKLGHVGTLAAEKMFSAATSWSFSDTFHALFPFSIRKSLLPKEIILIKTITGGKLNKLERKCKARRDISHNDKRLCSSHQERLPFARKNRLFQWDYKWNGSSQRKISGKKGIPLQVLPFSRFYRNDRNFLYHLSGLLVRGFLLRQKVTQAHTVPGVCKWYNSIPFVFQYGKKEPVPFVRKFSPKFP